VIVLTHEHWDHVSGFYSALEKFKGFTVGEIWAAWTENSADPQAAELDKFKGEALAALQGASRRLDRIQGLSRHLVTVQQGLSAVLSFNFGAILAQLLRRLRPNRHEQFGQPSPAVGELLPLQWFLTARRLCDLRNQGFRAEAGIADFLFFAAFVFDVFFLLALFFAADCRRLTNAHVRGNKNDTVDAAAISEAGFQ
jgi:hypothetical protein